MAFLEKKKKEPQRGPSFLLIVMIKERKGEKGEGGICLLSGKSRRYFLCFNLNGIGGEEKGRKILQSLIGNLKEKRKNEVG